MRLATLGVVRRGERFLLLKRNKEPNEGKWSPPGGHLEPCLGESPHECVAREILEETGISVRPDECRLMGLFTDRTSEAGEGWLLFVYDIPVESAEENGPGPEGEIRWFDRSEIGSLEVPILDRDILWPLFSTRPTFFSITVEDGPDGPRVIEEEIR